MLFFDLKYNVRKKFQNRLHFIIKPYLLHKKYCWQVELEWKMKEFIYYLIFQKNVF